MDYLTQFKQVYLTNPISDICIIQHKFPFNDVIGQKKVLTLHIPLWILCFLKAWAVCERLLMKNCILGHFSCPKMEVFGHYSIHTMLISLYENSKTNVLIVCLNTLIYGLHILWGASKLLSVKYGIWAILGPEICLFEHHLHTILVLLYINTIKGRNYLQKHADIWFTSVLGSFWAVICEILHFRPFFEIRGNFQSGPNVTLKSHNWEKPFLNLLPK